MAVTMEQHQQAKDLTCVFPMQQSLSTSFKRKRIAKECKSDYSLSVEAMEVEQRLMKILFFQADSFCEDPVIIEQEIQKAFKLAQDIAVLSFKFNYSSIKSSSMDRLGEDCGKCITSMTIWKAALQTTIQRRELLANELKSVLPQLVLNLQHLQAQAILPHQAQDEHPNDEDSPRLQKESKKETSDKQHVVRRKERMVSGSSLSVASMASPAKRISRAVLKRFFGAMEPFWGKNHQHRRYQASKTDRRKKGLQISPANVNVQCKIPILPLEADDVLSGGDELNCSRDGDCHREIPGVVENDSIENLDDVVPEGLGSDRNDKCLLRQVPAMKPTHPQEDKTSQSCEYSSEGTSDSDRNDKCHREVPMLKLTSLPQENTPCDACSDYSSSDCSAFSGNDKSHREIFGSRTAHSQGYEEISYDSGEDSSCESLSGCRNDESHREVSSIAQAQYEGNTSSHENGDSNSLACHVEKFEGLMQTLNQLLSLDEDVDELAVKRPSYETPEEMMAAQQNMMDAMESTLEETEAVMNIADQVYETRKGIFKRRSVIPDIHKNSAICQSPAKTVFDVIDEFAASPGKNIDDGSFCLSFHQGHVFLHV